MPSRLKSPSNPSVSALIRALVLTIFLFFSVLHNCVLAIRDYAHRRRAGIRFPRETVEHGRQGDEEFDKAVRSSQIHPRCLGHHAIDGE